MSFRAIRRSPAFAAVVILMLALTIGAGTAIFSFVHAVVLERLPVPNPERLALLSYQLNKREGTYNGYSYPVYEAIATANWAFDGVLARGAKSLDLSAGLVHGRVNAEFVSANYFHVLGIRPVVGRTFGSPGRIDSTENVVVISYRLWHERFTEDPAIIGRVIRLNRRAFQIIGVTEPAFSGTVLGQSADLQIPIWSAPFFQISLPNTTWLQLMGRLKPDMPWRRAEAISRAVATHAVESVQPWARGAQNYVLEDGSRGFADARKRLASPSMVLLAAVVLVLLIACSNIAGLLSARSIERQHEMAVRLSLGASRAQLVRQTLVESAVLALIGGCCGLVLAHWTIALLIQLLDNGSPAAMLKIGLDPPVLLASISASLLASLIFGVLPALQTSRANPVHELRRGGFSSGARQLRPVRRLLVVIQIALSVTLLCGAAVLSRSLRNLRTVDLGFDPKRVALLTVNPEADGYSPAGARSFITQLLEEAGRIPGVDAAAVSVVSPLSGSLMVFDVRVPGFTGSRKGAVDYVHIVSQNYFRALGTPILKGRDFSSHDQPGGHSVAIVNERFASFYWPGENPVGKRIKAQGLREVIALVKSANYRKVRETAPATVYLPLSQVAEEGVPSPGVTLLVRTHGNPIMLLGALRQALLSVDAGVSIQELSTLETQRDYTISTERTMAFLSTLFATLATVIALVGVAGVIALGVSSRVREIGVRRALGARGSGVASIFIKETLYLFTGGIAVGLPLARAASGVLEQFVFGLGAWDGQTALIVILVFAVTCLVAVLVPLRRAVAIEPNVALRQD